MTRLSLAQWRRTVAEMYADVRASSDPRMAHELWRGRRDALFLGHPESPLPAGDPLRDSGLPYFPYDPALRFDVPFVAETDGPTRQVQTATDGTIVLRRVGQVAVPEPIGAGMDVWWLEQYAGGLFLPVRDGTAGHETYGGGRYLLDTAKGADLGGDAQSLVLDFNFLFHPSCRYDVRWECPLAPEGNTLEVPIRAGERL